MYHSNCFHCGKPVFISFENWKLENETLHVNGLRYIMLFNTSTKKHYWSSETVFFFFVYDFVKINC